MLKVAVVGCGAIATHKFLPILSGLKSRVQLVAVCDVNKDALGQISAQFGIPHTYTGISDLLSERHPDVVVICTPPKTHAALTITALEGGAHVLVEKPMAVSVADCDRMNDSAKEHNRKLGVMHSQLFHAPLPQVRKEIAEGRYGQFLGMRVLLATGRDTWISDPGHWAHKLRGGVVGETGPHAVYHSLSFLKDVREVQVRMAKHHPEDTWLIGDDIRFDLVAANGMSSVSLDYGSNQTAAELDIMCTEQFLRVDLQSRTVVKHNRPVRKDLLSAGGIGRSVIGAAYQRLSGLAGNTLYHYFSKKLDGHYVGINEFLDYVAGEATFPATGEDGRRTVAVLSQVVEKLEELRTPLTDSADPNRKRN